MPHDATCDTPAARAGSDDWYRRRRPRLADLKPLVDLQLPRAGFARAIDGAQTIDDLRRIARRRAPKPVFDYVEGGADREVSIRRAAEAWNRVEFIPRALQPTTRVDTSSSVLNRITSMPLVLAPTGYSRLLHWDGEIAVGRAAAAADVPYVLSTMGTVSIEDLATALPSSADRWFQLYIWRDRERSEQLLVRASRAGYRALVLTVDVPVPGRRLRDVRNGFTIPPRLTPRSMLGIAVKPRWWFNLLSRPPLEFATMTTGQPVAPSEFGTTMFDRGVGMKDLAWVRERWRGPLVVKGILSPGDALAVAAEGADAVIVSNHGGRQLDRAVAPADVLPAVSATLRGRAEVLVDGGILCGADVAAAVALGAQAASAGRAYLYGLMAGGYAGVARALEIMKEEYERTLTLLGRPATSALDATAARLRPAAADIGAQPPLPWSAPAVRLANPGTSARTEGKSIDSYE